MLLGPNPPRALEEQYSNELHVKADSPPAFLFGTSDDPVVSAANNVRFYQAHIDLQLPVEMHLFEHGTHGVGLAKAVPRLQHWPDSLASWMRVRGWMAGGHDEVEYPA